MVGHWKFEERLGLLVEMKQAYGGPGAGALKEH
jgi:hypothetical protein